MAARGRAIPGLGKGLSRTSRVAGMRIIAHRGASAEAPENTLAAFARALQLGVEMIELDVRLTADGVPIVIHDADLARTTDGRGQVENLEFESIRRYSAGSWFDASFRDERVPTLAEVHDLVGDRAEMNVEIKGESGAVARGALQASRDAGALGRTLFSSFEPESLAAIRAASGEARLGLLTDPATLARPEKGAPPRFHDRIMARVSRWERLSLEAANLARPLAREPTVAALRERGLRVYVYTVDEVKAVEALARIGVDGVFANDPAPLLRRWPPPGA